MVGPHLFSSLPGLSGPDLKGKNLSSPSDTRPAGRPATGPVRTLGRPDERRKRRVPGPAPSCVIIAGSSPDRRPLRREEAPGDRPVARRVARRASSRRACKEGARPTTSDEPAAAAAPPAQPAPAEQPSESSGDAGTTPQPRPPTLRPGSRAIRPRIPFTNRFESSVDSSDAASTASLIATEVGTSAGAAARSTATRRIVRSSGRHPRERPLLRVLLEQAGRSRGPCSTTPSTSSSREPRHVAVGLAPRRQHVRRAPARDVGLVQDVDREAPGVAPRTSTYFTRSMYAPERVSTLTARPPRRTAARSRPRPSRAWPASARRSACRPSRPGRR